MHLRIIIVLIIQLSLFQNKNFSQEIIQAKTCFIDKNYIKKDTVIPNNMHDLLSSEGHCSWLCNGNIEISNIEPRNLLQLTNNLFKYYEVKMSNFKSDVFTFTIECNNLLDTNRVYLTSILFFNGVLESKKTWNNNSRIKTIDLLINKSLRYRLEFMDSDKIQLFQLPEPIALVQKITLSFQIVDKYNGFININPCFTRIYFDGTDGHSFVKNELYEWK